MLPDLILSPGSHGPTQPATAGERPGRAPSTFAALLGSASIAAPVIPAIPGSGTLAQPIVVDASLPAITAPIASLSADGAAITLPRSGTTTPLNVDRLVAPSGSEGKFTSEPRSGADAPALIATPRERPMVLTPGLPPVRSDDVHSANAAAQPAAGHSLTDETASTFAMLPPSTMSAPTVISGTDTPTLGPDKGFVNADRPVATITAGESALGTAPAILDDTGSAATLPQPANAPAPVAAALQAPAAGNEKDTSAAPVTAAALVAGARPIAEDRQDNAMTGKMLPDDAAPTTPPPPPAAPIVSRFAKLPEPSATKPRAGAHPSDPKLPTGDSVVARKSVAAPKRDAEGGRAKHSDGEGAAVINLLAAPRDDAEADPASDSISEGDGNGLLALMPQSDPQPEVTTASPTPQNTVQNAAPLPVRTGVIAAPVDAPAPAPAQSAASGQPTPPAAAALPVAEHATPSPPPGSASATPLDMPAPVAVAAAVVERPRFEVAPAATTSFQASQGVAMQQPMAADEAASAAVAPARRSDAPVRPALQRTAVADEAAAAPIVAGTDRLLRARPNTAFAVELPNVQAMPDAAPVDAQAQVDATATLTSAPIDTSRQEWLTAMIDRIETVMGEDNGKVETRIALSPDALGDVEVRLVETDQGIAVTLDAAAPEAKALLSEAAPRLSDMAEARGLRLSAQTMGGDGQGGQQRTPHRPDADAPLTNRRASNGAAEPSTDERIA
ncbi:flagellar hook-length control protein FliK [Sphingomonas sp. IW22]|uniref:flagellar hook-length control protein FliK n=1 Tax=Sphingomonas sp. IW22 TaxID=3242489 RepID=UPI003520B01B